MGGSGFTEPGRERRNAKRARAKLFVENARNDPRAEIRRRVGSTAKDGGKKRGRIEGGKTDSPKRPMGLCKRDIKISLQIASTTFPFRSRSAYRIETRETDCFRLASSSSGFVVVSLSRFHVLLTRLVGSERGFSATVAFLRLRIDSIVANIVSVAIVMIVKFSRRLTSRCSSIDITR